MHDYLEYRFIDDENFINTFDEAPLWSAAFGLLLFKHLKLRKGMTVVDVGSGTGFPLLEIAGRLGDSSKLFGVDPWMNANRRARQKVKNYGLKNVEIIECSADKMPFENDSIDLIVSNLGINNFSNPPAVFSECRRILKSDGRLALTTNLFGHWKEFYQLFYESLENLGMMELIPILKKDEEHRSTLQSLVQMFGECGMDVKRHFQENLNMYFADGSAFLNHPFVKLGWISTWLKLFPKEKTGEIFIRLENDLNKFALANNGLNLSVPMAFIEGIK